MNNTLKVRIMAMLMVISMAFISRVAYADSVLPQYTQDDFNYWTLTETISGFPYPQATNYCMNVLTWSTTTNSNGNKVTLYQAVQSSIDPAQTWAVKFHVDGGYPLVYSKLGFNASTGHGYTLNYNNSNGKCTVWIDDLSNQTDSEIDIHTQDYSHKLYKIYLPGRTKYLNAPSVGNSVQLEWTSATNTVWFAPDNSVYS